MRQLIAELQGQGFGMDFPERVARVVIAGITGGGSGVMGKLSEAGMIRESTSLAADYGLGTYAVATSGKAIEGLSDVLRSASDPYSYQSAIDGWKQLCSP